jgi:hypothetical protein
MSHTPGPWSAVGAFIENRNTGTAVCKTMCRFNNEGHFPVEVEADANARLIAAAPELAEALTNLLACSGKHYAHPAFIKARDDARAILVKLEGK